MSAAGSFWPRNLALQATLASEIAVQGRGLHTGRPTRLRLLPAEAGAGIRFRRMVGGRAVEIPALWTHRISQPLCTALSAEDGTIVRTVEHLLSALAVFAIDNATAELDGEETPILDGSARPWCAALRDAGFAEQSAPRACLRLREPVEFRQDRRSVRIEPAETFSVDCYSTLRGFEPMRWRGAPTPARYVEEIAPARSMGRVKWAVPGMVRALFSREPILRGAGLDNTAATLGPWVINGARFPDEFVRHRVLDVIGDLALAGAPILGRVSIRHPVHDFTGAFVEWLMRRDAVWEIR